MLRKADKEFFKDKKILVVGLARSGIGAANLLVSFGAEVWVTDIESREYLKDRLNKLSPSVKVIAGEHPAELFSSADLIIVSPGVPLDIPALVHARSAGVKIIGELELAYQMVKAGVMSRLSGSEGEAALSPSAVQAAAAQRPLPRFVGITGTNGKSTVTTLVDMMLKKANYRTVLGGNIGNALTEEISKWVINKKLWVLGQEPDKVNDFALTSSPAPDFIVTEISSFQLESIEKFEPFVAVMLNVTPDHLDRYDGMEQYAETKARIFENQGAGDYLIMNADDPVLMGLYNSKLIPDKSGQNSKLNVLFFSRQQEVEGIYYRNGSLHCSMFSAPRTAPSARVEQEEGAVSSPFEIIPVDEIKIKGVHNLENAMAASLASLICGCPADSIREVLKEFPGLEHRLELVCSIDGVSFINDSKGTNVGAVIKSLESFEKIILIMGGRDKDGDFSVLRSLVKEKVKALVLLGEAGEKIAKSLGDVIDPVFVNDMGEAVRTSMFKASEGDIVLLSPGCASFDMFTDFQDRGRRFKEEALQLTKGSRGQGVK